MPYSNKIKEIEHNRNDSNIGVIYLCKDNGGWFIAYEWSAYLCEFYHNGLKNNQRLKPTKKKTKENEIFIKVGLKEESMNKYLPDSNYIFDDEGNIIIEVDVTQYEDYIFCEDYHTLLNEWKDKIEIKIPKDKETNNTNVYNQPIKFFTIMSDIIKYDCDNKNVDELKSFIKKLKNDCCGLIC